MELKRRAAAENQSMAALIRESVAAYLLDEPARNTEEVVDPFVQILGLAAHFVIEPSQLPEDGSTTYKADLYGPSDSEP